MNKQLVFYVLIAACGILIGLLLQRPLYPEPHVTPASNFQDTQLSSKNAVQPAQDPSEFVADNTTTNLQISSLDIRQLTDELAKEQQARALLETKVAALEKKILAVQSIESTVIQDDTTTNTIRARSETTVVQSENWFNENALVVAGIDVSKIKYLRDQFEDIEMQQLYLRDQAVREGWINTDRYQSEVSALRSRNESLRTELSDKEYDAYLYASGKPNRVKIVSALSNSPASDAGIKPGDMILKYDNKRIYSWQDLRGATTEGQTNETVSVVIERDGRQQTIYLPRGPLGVRLDTDSVAP